MHNIPVGREIIEQLARWRDACVLDGVTPIFLVVLEPQGTHFVPRIYHASYLRPEIMPRLWGLLRECGEAYARGESVEGHTDV